MNITKGKTIYLYGDYTQERLVEILKTNGCELADQRAELLEFVKEMRSRYANSPWIASQCDELITKATNK